MIHHRKDIGSLMAEACWGASQGIVLEGYLGKGILAQETFFWMDSVSNKSFGFDLLHRYLAPIDWNTLSPKIGLAEELRLERLRLSPLSRNSIFGRSLHFIVERHLPTKALHE